MQPVPQPACPVCGTLDRTPDGFLGADDENVAPCPGNSGVEQLAGQQWRVRRRQNERHAVELAALRSMHRHGMDGLDGVQPHRWEELGCGTAREGGAYPVWCFDDDTRVAVVERHLIV